MSTAPELDGLTAHVFVELRVSLPDGTILRFGSAFHIGRESSCEVQVDDVLVSRRHALVTVHRGQWTIQDLQSSNGLFVDGHRVSAASIGTGRTIHLGADGPELLIEPDVQRRAVDSVPREGRSDDDWTDSPEQEAGPASSRTQLLRHGFELMLHQQRRRYRWAIALLALIALSAVAFAYQQAQLLAKKTAEAREAFYQLKALDVSIASGESSGAPQDRQRLAGQIAARRVKAQAYDQSATRLYDRRMNEKDRLILKVTRRLGECELGAPPGYVNEVKRYIGQWTGSTRFTTAVRKARDRGYTKYIVDAFAEADLPPQFFYLALQESDFEPLNVGPLTSKGYAKGMWQFIPDTGRQYGLRIGPMIGSRQPDSVDDRLDWLKATKAAARYVKYLYATDAQASGLLVMASYNWGEGRVIRLLKEMPDNPRERNFWRFVEQYRGRMPPETYGYVLNIVAAAVIGENPRLFGLDVDNPLSPFDP